MLPRLITQTQLELAMGGPVELKKYTDDDGDQVADPVVVDDILQKASDRGGNTLRSVFELEEIVDLIEGDSAVQDAFCGIAMGFCGDRRPAITDPRGFAMWSTKRKESIDYLHDIVRRKERSTAEGVGAVPKNPTTANKTNYDRPVPFQFAGSSNNPFGNGNF